MSPPEFEATVQAAVSASAGLDFVGFAALLGWGVARAGARLAARPPSAALAPGSALFAALCPGDPDAGDEAALRRRIALAAAFDARRAARAAGGLLLDVMTPAGRLRSSCGEGGAADAAALPTDPASYADAPSAAALLAVVAAAEGVVEAAAWARARAEE